jgi:hypothetical protein
MGNFNFFMINSNVSIHNIYGKTYPFKSTYIEAYNVKSLYLYKHNYNLRVSSQLQAFFLIKVLMLDFHGIISNGVDASPLQTILKIQESV